MKYKEALEFLNKKTREELVNAYREEYLEWKRTGVLQDGLIRDLYNILDEDDEHTPIHYAEQMFNERLAELWYLENK